MPEASIASITSPEHGAQQECRRTFLWPPGKGSGSREKSCMRQLYLGSEQAIRKMRPHTFSDSERPIQSSASGRRISGTKGFNRSEEVYLLLLIMYLLHL